METLPQKAGVPESKLSMLVCKELVDNALDLCGACEIGYEGDLFYVKDRGAGLDPDLFSISRPCDPPSIYVCPPEGHWATVCVWSPGRWPPRGASSMFAPGASITGSISKRMGRLSRNA